MLYGEDRSSGPQSQLFKFKSEAGKESKDDWRAEHDICGGFLHFLLVFSILRVMGVFYSFPNFIQNDSFIHSFINLHVVVTSKVHVEARGL